MIRRDDSTTTDMAITLEGGGVVRLNYTVGIQFPPGSQGAIDFITAMLFQDPSNMTRIAIKDLPNDDPDRDTDPGAGLTDPAMFWSDPRGRPNDELVSVSSYYTVTWDGEKYQFSARRARTA
jgi:hypothetical protein